MKKELLSYPSLADLDAAVVRRGVRACAGLSERERLAESARSAVLSGNLHALALVMAQLASAPQGAS